MHRGYGRGIPTDGRKFNLKKKEKKPKPKKEKKVKEKKVKEKKPPKVKKPKAPKPKKEKKPKPKKEKKSKKAPATAVAAADGETPEESGGRSGIQKMLLIALPVLIVLAGGGAFLMTRVFQRMPSGEPETSPGGEAVELEEVEPPPEEIELPLVEQPVEIRTSMTTAEVVSYVRGLPAVALGLDPDEMSSYEMYASESVVPIDGVLCSQVRVYSKDANAGTNEIEGIFYLSRGGQRKLYRYDEETDTVTEVSLSGVRVAPVAEEPPPQDADAAAD